MKAIIFTDLDASLLHEETFSCLEIIDTLNALQSVGVLIVPNTSKTEVETRHVLKLLNFTTPFIVENGAKFCDIHHMPYFTDEMDKAIGIPVSELVSLLVIKCNMICPLVSQQSQLKNSHGNQLFQNYSGLLRAQMMNDV